MAAASPLQLLQLAYNSVSPSSALASSGKYVLRDLQLAFEVRIVEKTYWLVTVQVTRGGVLCRSGFAHWKFKGCIFLTILSLPPITAASCLVVSFKLVPASMRTD